MGHQYLKIAEFWDFFPAPVPEGRELFCPDTLRAAGFSAYFGSNDGDAERQPLSDGTEWQ